MDSGDYKTLLKVVRDGIHSMDTDYKDICLRIVQGHLAAAIKQLEDKKRALATEDNPTQLAAE